MDIRFLTANDASEWWRLRLEALEGDPEAFSSSVEEHHALSQEDVRRRLGCRGAIRSWLARSAMAGSRCRGISSGVRAEVETQRESVGCVSHAGTARQRHRPEDDANRTEAGNGHRRSRACADLGCNHTDCRDKSLPLVGFRNFRTGTASFESRGRYIDEEYMVLQLKPRRTVNASSKAHKRKKRP